MKLNLKKINYHKWIPSRFSSFQAKLLIAFLVATPIPAMKNTAFGQVLRTLELKQVPASSGISSYGKG